MITEPDIRPFQAFDASARVFSSAARQMTAGGVPIPVIEASDDPITLPWERRLTEAAHDAVARGAKIELTRHGMLIRKGGKSELVRLEQIEHGILLRALNRVAPYPEELY